MIFDLQKASVLKRISAFLFDGILLSILAVGFAFLISVITRYDVYSEQYETITQSYAEEYGVNLELTENDYNNLPEAEQTAYQTAKETMMEAMRNDVELGKASSMLMSLVLLMVSLGVFLAVFVIEFLVPLLFKNGQTLGKKVFGIAVIHPNGVRIAPLALFTRSVLGKYTIEIMAPVLLVAMMLAGIIGIVAPIILLLLLALQIYTWVSSKNNSLIHDVISYTVTVDMASQLIFDTESDMIAYKAKASAEAAQKKPY